MAKTILTAERARELVNYDPATAALTWLVAAGLQGCIPAGTVAGHLNKRGRRVVRIDGVLVFASRLIWLWMTGEQPSGDIDHMDGNPGNDVWSNLRDVTKSINQQNRRHASRNKASGLPLGVYEHRGAFRAEIRVNKTRKHIGVFTTPEAASDAYLAEKRRLHPGGLI